MNQENLAMGLIVASGNAKSLAMEVIKLAKQGKFAEAEAQYKLAEEGMVGAHRQQTEILQQSFENPEEGVTMLMSHAQDHMMNAITTVDLAREFLDLYQIVLKREEI